MSKKTAVPKREEGIGQLRKPPTHNSHITETLLKVYLQPKASKNEIVGPYRDGIKVKITAPPVEGKANKALLRFLAAALDLSLSQIEILKGHHSREKVLRLSGVDLSLITQRLKAVCN